MARRARVADEEPHAEEAPRPPVVRHEATYLGSDGLRLHAEVYGDPLSPWLPVVCLPGLSRTARDFADLAAYLSTSRYRPRRVVAFDYRGRGRSAWDANATNYNPLTEMRDVLDGMAALGIGRAVIAGTSRGGIIAMLMGVARPTSFAGVILNDIGPVIEPRGLARIKSYVGRTPTPDDWRDAVAILQRLHGAQFTGLSRDDWEAFARATYRDVDGVPAVDYDPALGRTFDGVEFDQPVPALWNEFRTLLSVPVLVIRGENSDILASSTVTAMETIHPRLDVIEVPGEGHPPLLRRPWLLRQIGAFVGSVEGSGPPADAFLPVQQQAYDLNAAPEPPLPADAGPDVAQPSS